MSRRRGKPVEPRVPNSWWLKRYLAHPIVSIRVSGGRDLASVVKYERLFSEPSQPPMKKMRFSSPEDMAFNTSIQTQFTLHMHNQVNACFEQKLLFLLHNMYLSISSTFPLIYWHESLQKANLQTNSNMLIKMLALV